MNYRLLAGEKVSILGFGAMRLPLNAKGAVDEAASISLIRKSADMGVNYVDTAFVYHGGESETIIGKALSKKYRDKVKIATKLPLWLCNEKADFDKYLNEQLKKLDCGHIDFYMVHALGRDPWKKARELEILSYMQKAKKDGRIGHIGFSFHDRFESFVEITDAFDWEFCQIQYNYMDEDFQAGRKGMEYAAKKGISVIVMEPLRGGSLAKNLPDSVAGIFDSLKPRRSPADMALNFVWNRPEASILLSGMNSDEQLEENVKLASSPSAGSLGEAGMAAIEKVRCEFLKFVKVPCTNCGYCLPCKSGVDIPNNFILYNGLYMYEKANSAKMSYNVFTPPNKRASACTSCGECVAKCPQKIDIPARLKDTHKALFDGPGK